MTDRTTQQRKRLRMREVEELYLNGYCAKEIHDLIGAKHDVTYGTIRNDIVAVRKMWGDDLTHQDVTEGKRRFLASLRSVRRKALTGFRENTIRGDVRIKGRDYRLAYEIDKEIARVSGVTLASDTRTLNVSIEQARAYMDEVMRVVFKHVTDPELQEAIIRDIEALSDGQS